jgi:hypothetical protein
VFSPSFPSNPSRREHFFYVLFLFCPLIRSPNLKLVQFSHTNSDFHVPYIKINQKFFWIHPSPALLGFENFILAKNWSQDPLFLVTSFSSILDPSSEFSTGHVFHLFQLKFSVVTSCVLLSEEENIKK